MSRLIRWAIVFALCASPVWAQHVEQRRSGDTLWATGGPASPGFVLRQVYRRGTLADTMTVDWMHADTVVRSRMFVYRGDTIWQVTPTASTRLSGFDFVYARGARKSFQAYLRLEALDLMQRKPPP